MNFNRKKHSCFIQYLDRTAEKNPLLWLPCVLLIALALAAEHIAEYAKIAYLHRNTEKVIREKTQPEKKPFFLRAVAVTVTAAFSLMLVPVTSFDAFGEEYEPTTEQIAFNEVSETEETPALDETTVPTETTVPEEAFEPAETTVPDGINVIDEIIEPKETPEPEDPTVTEVTTAPEETSEPEETTDSDGTTSPEETPEPDVTTAPDVTNDPDVTTDPEVTTAPEETPEPDVTTDPDVTTAPEETDPIEDHEHIFGNVLTNENGHYWVCTICNHVTEFDHRFESDWESNCTEHWHQCDYCELKKDVEAHDYEWDFFDSEHHCLACTVCGKVTKIGNHIVNNWGYNSNRHWGKCICGERLSEGAHQFDGNFILNEDGETPVKRYYCTWGCGYYYDEPVEHIHIHTPVDKWSYNKLNHWHECTSCDQNVDTANHNYSIKVTVEPTQTSTGTRVYTCTVCGYSYSETIPKLGHTHTFSTEWHKDVNAHWHECTACGEHFDTASHNDNNVVDTVKPTATTAGIRTYSCSVCGYIMRTEPIPPINESEPTYPVNPTPSYPTITSPASTTVREPYIYGDTSKTGWDTIISEIDLAMDGDTVRVNMNGTTEIPQSAVLHILNRYINLELNMGSTVWNINGFDVTNPKTINLSVSERSNIIPTSVIDNLSSELEPKEYRLYHSGDFGFKATLTLNVEKRYNNYFAALYHYNTKTKQLEFVDESFVENRQVTFELTHASYYAVAFNSIPMYDDVSSGAGAFESSVPIETSAMPETNGVTIPAVKLPQIMKYSNKKRKYRILRKRRLDDLVFVF